MNRIAIVGSGAVGGYYGARLAESGLNVHFLLKSDYEHIQKHGWSIKSVHGDIELPSVQCARRAGEIGPVDLVIVAWKTTANQHYREVIGPLIDKNTLILSLQNGLGSTEELARIFGAWRIFGGLCFVCINRTAPGQLCHSASGLVRVGQLEPDSARIPQRLAALVDLLKGANIHAQAVSDLEKAQWMKLIWNIPFNGLAIAEGGVNTGELLRRPGMEERIRRLMKEVQAAANAMGHHIEDDFLDQQIEVTRPMKAYRPSSMIDYLEGREVEVDSIWREPLSRARILGVEMPELERLLTEIDERILCRGN